MDDAVELVEVLLQEGRGLAVVMHDVAHMHRRGVCQGDRGHAPLHFAGEYAGRQRIAVRGDKQVGERPAVGYADIAVAGNIAKRFLGVIEGVRGPLPTSRPIRATALSKAPRTPSITPRNLLAISLATATYESRTAEHLLTYLSRRTVTPCRPVSSPMKCNGVWHRSR